MYLAEDHAAVNAAGHGDPANAGYRELPEQPATEGRFRALREIPVAPITAQDFILVKAQLSGPFALAIRPGGLRHDAVCLIWNTIKGEWRIVGILPIVD
jgi:hypothetical protein